MQGQNMVDIIKAEMEAIGPDIVSRVYSGMIGPLNTVVHEMEFQDLGARAQFWTEWAEKRNTPEFWEKWNKAFGQSGNVEIWNLE
jgi:hypothetical protein